MEQDEAYSSQERLGVVAESPAFEAEEAIQSGRLAEAEAVLEALAIINPSYAFYTTVIDIVKDGFRDERLRFYNIDHLKNLDAVELREVPDALPHIKAALAVLEEDYAQMVAERAASLHDVVAGLQSLPGLMGLVRADTFDPLLDIEIVQDDNGMVRPVLCGASGAEYEATVYNKIYIDTLRLPAQVELQLAELYQQGSGER